MPEELRHLRELRVIGGPADGIVFALPDDGTVPFPGVRYVNGTFEPGPLTVDQETAYSLETVNGEWVYLSVSQTIFRKDRTGPSD